MAEEENTAVEETAEDAEKVKKSPLKKLIILGLGLVVLGGGGLAGWNPGEAKYRGVLNRAESERMT